MANSSGPDTQLSHDLPEQNHLSVRTLTGRSSLTIDVAINQRWDAGVNVILSDWSGYYRREAKKIRNIDDFWEICRDLDIASEPSSRIERGFLIRTELEAIEALSQKLQVTFNTACIWGILSQIIKIVIHFDSVVYQLGQMLSHLTRHFTPFLTLQLTSHTANAVLESGLEIHLELLKFLVHLIRTLEEGPPENLSAQDWANLDAQTFSTQKAIDLNLSRIETVPKEVKEEQRLQGLADRQETLAMDIDQSTKNAKLPIILLPRAANKRFFDRTEIFKSIDEELHRGESGQDVALHGLNGVGKSEIALQYAHSRTKDYDAVLWVHSQSETTISQSFTNIAVKLELEGATAKPDSYIFNKVILLTWLQRTAAKWLLIYDNVEDAVLLEEHWPVVKKGAVIVTTRNRSIAFHPASAGISIEAFDEENGLGLLFTLVRRPSDGPDRSSANQLINHLGGLPLAIYNMAGLIATRSWNIPAFVDMYENNMSRVHRLTRDGRSIGTNWQLTFDNLEEMPSALLGVFALLEAEEIPQELFHLPKTTIGIPPEFSFLMDKFSFENEALGFLIERHLVKRGLDDGNFSVHRLVQFEFRSFVEPERLQLIFNVTSQLLFEAFPQQKTGEQMHTLWSYCAAYLRHVLALFAVYRDLEKERIPLRPTATFLRLLSNCAWHLYETARYNQGLEILETAVRAWDILEEKEQKLNETIYTILCNIQGVMNHWLGNFEISESYYNKVLERYKVLFPKGGIFHLGNTYFNLGNLNCSLGRVDKALDHCLEALRHIDGEPPLPSLAMKNAGLGRCYALLGRYEVAKIYLGQALAQNRELENWFVQAHVHRMIGDVCYHQEDLESAEGHYNESRKLLVGVSGSKTNQMTGACYNRLGCLAQRKGDLQKAIEWYRDALNISNFNPSCKGYRARALYKLAKALQQDPNQAKEASERLSEAQILRKYIMGIMHTTVGDDEELAYDNLVVIHVR